MTEAAAPARKPSRFMRSIRALKDRRMAAMVLLSFASGLPYGAVLGTLNAWLTEVGIKPGEIGILSLLAIGYAFKYLWAPAFQTPKPVPLPFLSKLGGRRSWLILFQLILAGLIALLARSNPSENIGFIAVISLIACLVSATHDIVLDAWRIEVARSPDDKDLMSALFQFGYKSAGFVTGFFALIMAAHFGWPAVYLMIAVFLLLAISGTLMAPDAAADGLSAPQRETFYPSLPSDVSQTAVIGVALGWLVSFYLILNFAFGRLVFGLTTSGGEFVSKQGPWIVLFTVLAPALVSAYLLFGKGARASLEPVLQTGPRRQSLFRSLFRAIFDPMMDLIWRLRWGAILVLLLALTYRFTDAVWGTFAYPFYMGAEGGALGHTSVEVGIASKFFGVIATILGSLVGVFLFSVIGRMPVFFIGGVIAAVTNLLYADLATGADNMDAFLAATRLDGPLIAFANWAALLEPDGTLLAADQGQKMARLMMTIFAENLAGGLALVAMTAYLTSVVNPRFAAVQYALLASLTMLIGTLGRPLLGELIEARGYHFVFMATFWLGDVAVILSLIEWWRLSREKPDEAALVLEKA